MGSALSSATARAQGSASTPQLLSSPFPSCPCAVNFAAINSAQWEDGLACGKCVRARCVHKMCTTHEWKIVRIVDKCPECA